jgi:hypothetical protein
MIVTCCIVLRIRNISDKSCRENQNMHFMLSNVFQKNCVVCEIMWKNVVGQDRPHMTIEKGSCALHAE